MIGPGVFVGIGVVAVVAAGAGGSTDLVTVVRGWRGFQVQVLAVRL